MKIRPSNWWCLRRQHFLDFTSHVFSPVFVVLLFGISCFLHSLHFSCLSLSLLRRSLHPVFVSAFSYLEGRNAVHFLQCRLLSWDSRVSFWVDQKNEFPGSSRWRFCVLSLFCLIFRPFVFLQGKVVFLRTLSVLWFLCDILRVFFCRFFCFV